MVNVGRLLVPWYRYPPFDRDRVGGLSVAVWELTAELGRRGIQVDVLTPEPATQNDWTPSGVRAVVSPVGRKFLNNQPLVRNEEKMLDDYDKVLSIGNYAARTLNSSKRREIVVRQIHAIGQDRGLSSYVSLTPTLTEYLRMMWAKRKDERNMTLLRGSKTLCVSEFIRHRMEDGLEDAKNLDFIPNGIYTEQFRPMQVNKDFDLLYIGRFQKSKGLDILLKALNLITQSGKQVFNLGIVGAFSTDERSYLFRNVRSGLREHIIFLGTIQRQEIPAVINRSRLVVVPARYESFGLPALEAIACGVPVIAARVGGLPEIIDGTVGLLVEPGDPVALAYGISQLVRNDDFAERVRVAGPSRAKRYDWSRVASEMEQAIFS